MPTLTKFPWLSWSLLLSVYAVFGWLVASDSVSWDSFLLNNFKMWGFEINPAELDRLLKLSIAVIESLVIFMITVIFSAPFSVLKIVFKKPLSSNLVNFLYILIWSFLFAVTLAWFSYLFRFLILIASASLLRLELHKLDYGELQSSILIATSGLLSFGVGILAFEMWGINGKSI